MKPFKGEVKPLRLGQVYYVPCVSRRRMYIQLTWNGSEWDDMRMRRGLVHTTPILAVKQAAEMLKVILGE